MPEGMCSISSIFCVNPEVFLQWEMHPHCYESIKDQQWVFLCVQLSIFSFSPVLGLEVCWWGNPICDFEQVGKQQNNV